MTRRPRILALVQAGGSGSRLDVLTREMPKPSLPFAGNYRLIDFPMSNLRNSGISDVWLSVQYLGQQLADVVANGKPWDLDRHSGGFRLIHPEQGSGSPAEEGFVNGNAEELLQNRDAIDGFGADAVVVMSADHVYRLDYAEVVETHLSRAAECTLVTTEVGLTEASHHAVITATEDGKVSRLDYKPEKASTGVVATEVFVYQPATLIEVLEDLHRQLSRTADDHATSHLGDFGEHLLPALIERGRTYAYPMPGYWRDLGRPETYYAAHQELLDSDTSLFTASWPITTNTDRFLPARVAPDASVIDSMLSAECRIAGTVRHSVLGPGVAVAAGASVTNSILHTDVTVEAGATINAAIVAAGCRICEDASIGRLHGGEPGQPELCLIGRDSVITSGDVVLPGARLEPGTTT